MSLNMNIGKYGSMIMRKIKFRAWEKLSKRWADWDKMKNENKEKVISYFAIGWYFLQVTFSIVFIYAGLISTVAPLIAKIVWIIIWSLYFAYLVSLLGKSYDYLDKGIEVRWNGKI